MALTHDQLHYLSNDVYRISRTRTLKQETLYGTHGGGGMTGNGLPIPGNPTRLTHASWQAGISEANPTHGLPHPHGIIIDQDTLEAFMYELTVPEIIAWEDATETDTNRRVLWTPNTSKGKLYWRPNPHLPALAPTVGIKITERLHSFGLIWPATPEQHQQLRDDRGKPPESVMDVIERALAAVG